MNKKGQTEDVFADLIPSLIIIALGALILYYFSFNFDEEISDSKLMIARMSDRESFSVEGMMNHQVEMQGKKYKIIELIDEYSRAEEGKGGYETALETGTKEYLLQADPRIVTCFKITLITSLQNELSLVDLCELNTLEDVKSELAILPLTEGYAKIRIEHGEPDI